MNAGQSLTRRPGTLAAVLMTELQARIDDGRLAVEAQLPTEAALMAQFDVSRTVVREALSKLQAAGRVITRHGVGTFVASKARDSTFRIGARHMATLNDVVAVLELRIGVETEAAGLAAQRRTSGNLAVMRQALDSFSAAIGQGRDAVAADFQFHSEIARATQNEHFAKLLATLGASIIPRARLAAVEGREPDHLDYLRSVNAEHESIFNAIRHADADAARAAMRNHLGNSRERRRRSVASGGVGAV